MSELIDNLARTLANSSSRREVVKQIALAAATMLGLTSCKDLTGASAKHCNSGDIDCNGDGTFCCKSGNSCCFHAVVCCPSGFPHHCANTHSCYQTFVGARRARCANQHAL